MKFVFYGRDGEVRDLAMEEVHQRLTDAQIDDAVKSKVADPLEEVSYMTRGGMISLEIVDPRGSERW